MWDGHFERLAREYRAVRYDAPGFGRSPLPPGPFSNTDDLGGLLDALGIERAALVGCSMGAGIALDFSLLHPDRVRALVLVAGAPGGHEWSEEDERLSAQEEEAFERGDLEAVVELNLRWWVDGPHRTPDEVDASVRERVGTMLREATAVQLAAYALPAQPGAPQRLDPPAIGRLEEVSAPTLIVAGDLDVPGIVTSADLLEANIPSARKVLFSGTAHLPSMERPAEFDELVAGFLRDQD